MKNLFRVFFWGMGVSFLGSLPLSTMNITVTQVSIQYGIMEGFEFAIGSMISEVIIVRIALVSISWLAKKSRIFRLLECATILIILFLAIASFIAAYRMTGFGSPLPIDTIKPFWTGVFLSLISPLHIPFWLGWTTVLMNKNILQVSSRQYNLYVFGIGTGTVFGLAIFIYGGGLLVAKIQQHSALLNICIGIVLLITVTIQMKKMIEVPASLRYNKMRRS